MPWFHVLAQDDHIPGAINLPVLDYDQRHQV
jgi:hypothetical protein